MVNLKVVLLFLLDLPVVRVDRVVMVVVVLVRPEVVSGNVASALLRDRAHRFAGHGVVVGAADVHLDGRRLGAGRRTAACEIKATVLTTKAIISV